MVTLLSAGLYDKKRILKDNPGITDLTHIKDRKKKLAVARGLSSYKNKNTRNSNNSLIDNSEKSYTPAPNRVYVVDLINNILEERNLRKENNSNNSNFYYNLDKFLKGYLPGAYTREEVTTMNNLKRSNDLIELNKVNEKLFEQELIKARNKLLFDMQQDLLKKSFFENLGIGYSNNEKFLRNLFEIQASSIENAEQLPKTSESVYKYEEVIKNTPNAEKIIKQATPSSFDWKSVLLITGAVLGGLMILKKK